ncbi:MAG: hypothetical protein IPM50_10095 [Acidobacteriota bacterium]|nr:MAG: hypothetical protein IPM50_10095 [Acidobacteriota bacterium]
MEIIEKLGEEVERRWKAENYNEDKLPEIAADALRKAHAHEHITAWEVAEWSLRQTELPVQRDLAARFGDPPITLYSAPRFHIDVYFWFEGTTAIHQHAFCGAFQVLHGSSIHSWYEFNSDRRINMFYETGEMNLKVCQLLEIGDVQEIWPGRQYIHSLFHLDQPSATLIIRTDRSPLEQPQFSYHKPGLAIDPFFEQPTVVKQAQVLAAFVRAGREDADTLIREYLAGADLQTTFNLLVHIRGYLRTDQIGSFFLPQDKSARFNAMLEAVEERHGEDAAMIRRVFAHYDIIDEILIRRGYVTQPELRFFLALLMNLDSRDAIFALIRQRFPDTDPVEKVLDWIFDLAQTRIFGVEGANAIGIAEFGDAEMTVLEEMLRGRPDDEIAAENSANSAAVEKIRGSAIFRPLMTP